MCVEARCRAIVLFDVDAPSGGARNIESPAQVRELIAHIRETLGAGTIIAIDQEGGSVQRLRTARGFVDSPSAADYARMSIEERADEAKALAGQLASLGIDLNFAPCVDVAINGDSPIIARRGRSFGDDPAAVARLAREVVEAHRAAGVTPCLKHFPGHGSAASDSHLGLPDITGVWDEERELAPFASMVSSSPPIAVMTAHLLHRGVDAEFPASLSRAWTTAGLRERLGFDGVVVTDSLDMRAIADRWPSGEAAALALVAGADLALDANNMPGLARECPALKMAAAIRRAVDSGALSEDALRRSAQRIEEITRRGVSSAAPPPA
jgi:beta-N-acetylhexosaminidase